MVQNEFKPVSFHISLNPVSFHLCTRTVGVIRDASRIAPRLIGAFRICDRGIMLAHGLPLHFRRVIEVSCGLYRDRDSINETIARQPLWKCRFSESSAVVYGYIYLVRVSPDRNLADLFVCVGTMLQDRPGDNVEARTYRVTFTLRLSISTSDVLRRRSTFIRRSWSIRVASWLEILLIFGRCVCLFIFFFFHDSIPLTRPR